MSQSSRPSATATNRGASAANKGARQAKTGFIDVSRSYWRHHLSSLALTFSRLISTPIQTLMTSLVVAIALALPALLLVTLNNVQIVGESWDANPKVSLYLNTRAKKTAIDSLLKRLKLESNVESLDYIDAEQALVDFQELSGFGQALSALDENPLPPSIEITPDIEKISPDELVIFAQKLEQDPVVDQAIVDMDWVRRLLEFMALGRKIVYSLALLLGLGVLLAVGNTVRLEIENRRDEIVIAKLVGASDGFVRRPFLYTGVWYGVFGGLLAAFIVTFGFLVIDGTVERLVSLYDGTFTLQSLGVTGFMQLMLFSVLLGWLGAWLAVGRHLSAIQPT